MWRSFVDVLLFLAGTGRRVWRQQLLFLAIVFAGAILVASSGVSLAQGPRALIMGALVLAFGARIPRLEAWEHLALGGPVAVVFHVFAADPPFEVWEYSFPVVGLGLYWAGVTIGGPRARSED